MTGQQVPEHGQPMIDPLHCMGEVEESLMRALMFARAALIQLQQRYRDLQEQHEALGAAFDARGKEIEKLKADLETLGKPISTRVTHRAPIQITTGAFAAEEAG